MGPRRHAVSTYVEVMVLIALVLGSSTLVYSAAANLAASSQGGAALTISLATIKQGTDAAVEKVTIANTGSVAITSFTIATTGVTSSATCYLSILNPATGSVTSSTCSFTGPVSSGTISLLPGQSVVATATLDSSPFTVGARYTVLVSASPPAQATAAVVAVSA